MTADPPAVPISDAIIEKLDVAIGQDVRAKREWRKGKSESVKAVIWKFFDWHYGDEGVRCFVEQIIARIRAEQSAREAAEARATKAEYEAILCRKQMEAAETRLGQVSRRASAAEAALKRPIPTQEAPPHG